MFTGKFVWKLISLCNHKFFVSIFSPFLILTSFLCANYFYIFLHFTSFNFPHALIFYRLFLYSFIFLLIYIFLCPSSFRFIPFHFFCFHVFLAICLLILFYICPFALFSMTFFSFYSCLQIFCKLYLFLFFNILHRTPIFVSFLSAFDF